MMAIVSNILTFFSTSSRGKNDETNKIRENVLSGINKLPIKFLQDPEYGSKWNILSREWNDNITILSEGISYTSYKIIHKGGRKANYDFMLSFYNDEAIIKQQMIEFKYGATDIESIPQFLSLQAKIPFFSVTYDKFYYDYYLDEYIACDGSITEPKPSLDVYLKHITNTCFDVLPFFAQLKECEENNKKEKAKIVNKSIENYLLQYGPSINIQAFIEKIKSTQKDKIYLLWNKGKFYIDKLDDVDTIKFKSIEKNNRIELISGNGNLYKLLLRWRNHKGILNPAWQISLKKL